jgi:xanthine dehydrogenase YagR molybdenum-binding subunit
MNETTAVIGEAIDRTDGVAKVTGTATYSGEFKFDGLCHAVIVQSQIPSGRIARIDDSRASAAPGVIAVLTHLNALRLAGGKSADPPAERVLSVLQDDRVNYNGQPVAVVVAATLEEAKRGAELLVIDYKQDAPALDFARGKAGAFAPDKINGEKPDSSRGDLAAALASAAGRVDVTYTTPPEFHNPMEPHATIASWQGDKLTLHDSTQGVTSLKKAIAKIFGIDPQSVRTVCLYTGGGFGCKGSMWSHVVLATMAARMVNRPVKLSLERDQMFFSVGHRPHTEQHMVLGADRGGRLLGIRHDSICMTSMIEDWTESSGMVTRMLYASDAAQTSHRLVKLNVGTGTFMRAPGEASGSFAVEAAMDELAYQLSIDPIALRLASYSEVDPGKNLPFSSKSLRECYRQGAERFAWSRRTAAPRSLRAGHSLVGLGMATATYPARRQEAEALARLNSDGTIVVRSATQDLGTGTYTIMTQVAAETLGVPLRLVRFELGDSRYPTAPGSGGSTTAATVGPAVQAACLALKQKIIDSAIGDPNSPLYQANVSDTDIAEGFVLRRGEPGRRDSLAALASRQKGEPLEAQGKAAPGEEKQMYSTHSFGAVFAEVHVDESLGTIRVQRLVGAYDVGRLMNEKTAHSQLMGGMVFGIGMALFEKGELDHRYGRIVNNNLAEYHVPVNADVHGIEVIVIPGSDTIFNPIGARGIGEIGITGVAGAICNAIYHATGRRVRSLPITLDTQI